MTGTRILEVHRPTGYHNGGWPTCAACLEAYPCWDVLRVIGHPRQGDRP